ncbi:MAG TPA: class I SAM-dependent methyltransferase [Phycisphaerales bacterium]|nr:class I SAM-dependent methyltransferase [Phycisphaerales bacterium]
MRSAADALVRKIEHLRAPRLENTPKRALQGMGARLAAANLERLQIALCVMASAHEDGLVPAGLHHLRTRSEIEPMVTKRIDSTGYYHVKESDSFRDESETAKSLRAFIDQHKGDKERQRERETSIATAVAQLEGAVRFSDIPGFFPTPPDIIAKMIAAAALERDMKALEPSAGKGDILAALEAKGCNAVGFEINWTLAEVCQRKGLRCERADFIDVEPLPILDRVVMNPPFEKLQDAKHVRRAFDWLKPGGRIVALVAAGTPDHSRASWFRTWLSEVGAVIEPLPAGAFAGAFRSTNVGVAMLIIDRNRVGAHE